MTVTDPYQILGVDRGATPDQVKKAYKKLSMKYHPDREGGDEEQFKKIKAAYEQITNPEPTGHYSTHQDFEGWDFDSIFNQFGTRFRQQSNQRAVAQLWLTIPDLIEGGSKLISMTVNGKQHDVVIQIPPNVQDGSQVRYRDMLPNNQDLIVVFRIKPDPQWMVDGHNLVTVMPISVLELIAGTDIELLTPEGKKLKLKIAPGTQPAKMLRVGGHGLARMHNRRGDIIVQLQGFIPEDLDDNLVQYIRNHIGQ